MNSCIYIYIYSSLKHMQGAFNSWNFIYCCKITFRPDFVIYVFCCCFFFAISYMQWLYETDIVILVYTLFHVLCWFLSFHILDVFMFAFFSTLPVSDMWYCLELYQCLRVQCDAAVSIRVTAMSSIFNWIQALQVSVPLGLPCLVLVPVTPSAVICLPSDSVCCGIIIFL